MNDVGVTGGERIGLAYVDLGANIQPMQAGLAMVTGLLNAWVVRTQADMDTAMRNIWTIVDTNEQGLARYQQQIVQLSRTVPQTQKQLAEGFYQLVSASINAADAMYVLEVASKAASAGMTSTYTAVDAITTVINAYGLEASKAGIIADIMFKAVEKGKLTFEQLAGSMGGVISTAAAAGVSFEEVAGAFATMTRTGISADEASTALNSTLMQLISPSSEAAVAAKELGIEWNLSALESKGLVGVLQDLERATGGNAELINMFVPNVRAMKGVLNLTRNDVKDFAADVLTMNDALGKADEAFEKQAGSVNNSFQLMKNAMSEWGIAMGRSTEPAVRSLASAMTDLSQKFSELPEGTQRIILAVTLATTSFGVLQKAVGGLVTMFSGPAGWIALIGAAAAAIVTIIERHQKWNEVALQTADKQKAVVEKLIDSADKTGASAKKLEALIDAYEKLSSKTSSLRDDQEKLADKSKRLKEAMDELASKTGLTKDEQEKLRSKTAELRDVEVDLKDKTAALKDEQAKLNDAAAGIGKIAPGVVSAWDDMGRAISINLDGAKEKLANLYEAQAIYLRAAKASNEKSIQAMQTDIVKADAELEKLNKDFEKISPLYNLGQLIQADKAGWDARREQWAKELDRGGYRYENGVRVSNLTYDDLLRFMSDGSSEFEKAIREALAYLQTTSYKDYPYVSINDIQREALAKATVGDKIIDRQAELLGMKVEMAKLELDAEKLRLEIKGLEESVTTLGQTASTGTGGKKDDEAAPSVVAKTTDKMTELNDAIGRILEPFTYKDKTISGLEFALKQLESLLGKYPANEQDPTGEFHLERLAIKQAQYTLGKDLQSMLADQASKLLAERLGAAESSSARIIEAAKEYVDIISKLDVSMLDRPALENLLQSISTEREKWGDLWTEGIPGASDKMAQKSMEIISQLESVARKEKLVRAASSSSGILADAEKYIEAISSIDISVLDREALDNLILSLAIEREKWSDLWTEGMPGAADIMSRKAQEAASRIAHLWAVEQKKVADDRLKLAEGSSSDLLAAAGAYVDAISNIDVSMLDKDALGNLTQSIAVEREKWSDLWTEGIPGAADIMSRKAQEAATRIVQLEQDERLQTAEERLKSAKASSRDLLESAQQYLDAVSGLDISTLDKDALGNLLQSIAAEREKWGDLWTEGIPGAADKLAQKSMEAGARLLSLEAEAAAAISTRLVDEAIREITERIQKGDINKAFIENAYSQLYGLEEQYAAGDPALQGKINATLLEVWKAEQEVIDEALKQAQADAKASVSAAQELLMMNLSASLSEIDAAKIAAERLLYDAKEAISQSGGSLDVMQAWHDALSRARAEDYGDYLGASQMIEAFLGELAEKIKADKKAAWELWIKTMGDRLLPEYGDNIMTEAEVVAFVEKKLAENRRASNLAEPGGSGDDYAILDKWLKSFYETNRKLASLPEIMSADDVQVVLDGLKKITEAERRLADERQRIAESVAQRGVSNLLSMFTGAGDVLTRAVRGEYPSGTVGSEQALKEIFAPFERYAREYWDGVADLMKNKGMNFQDAQDLINENFARQITQSGRLLSDALKTIGQRLQSYDNTLFQNLGENVEKLGSKLGDATTKVGSFLIGLGETLGTVGLIISVIGVIINIIMSIVNFFKRRKEKEEEESKRPAFQISEISGPMRDTIVTALDPLKVLYSYPTYKDEIVMAINSVREAILGSSALGAAAAQTGIQQYFSINTINITAANGETFSQIMMDLDRQIRLAEAGVGG